MTDSAETHQPACWLPPRYDVHFVPPFDDAQVLVLYDEDAVRDFFRENEVPEERLEEGLYSKAVAIYEPHEDGALFIMSFHRDRTEPTVWHECLHMAWHLLNHHGVILTWENHEMLAYLQGYLAERVLKSIGTTQHKVVAED